LAAVTVTMMVARHLGPAMVMTVTGLLAAAMMVLALATTQAVHRLFVFRLGLLDHAARHQLVEHLSHRHRRIGLDHVSDGVADRGYVGALAARRELSRA
jgi:hypothetical protein